MCHCLIVIGCLGFEIDAGLPLLELDLSVLWERRRQSESSLLTSAGRFACSISTSRAFSAASFFASAISCCFQKEQLCEIDLLLLQTLELDDNLFMCRNCRSEEGFGRLARLHLARSSSAVGPRQWPTPPREKIRECSPLNRPSAQDCHRCDHDTPRRLLVCSCGSDVATRSSGTSKPNQSIVDSQMTTVLACCSSFPFQNSAMRNHARLDADSPKWCTWFTVPQTGHDHVIRKMKPVKKGINRDAISTLAQATAEIDAYCGDVCSASRIATSMVPPALEGRVKQRCRWSPTSWLFAGQVPQLMIFWKGLGFESMASFLDIMPKEATILGSAINMLAFSVFRRIL